MTVHTRPQSDVSVESNNAGLAESARQGNWATLNHGQDDVTTAGTSVALNGGTGLAIPDGAALAVRADGDNAGSIFVGDGTVSSSNGFVLGAGESVTLHVDDVSDVNIDAGNDGDGVSWIVESA